MPKRKNRLPILCRDRNQAFSWHNGRRICHGVWGSPEAEKSYKRFIAALLESPNLPVRLGEDNDALVSELVDGFLEHVEPQMSKTDWGDFYRFFSRLARSFFVSARLCLLLCRPLDNTKT
jgi:hypothetical protein